MVRVTGIAVRRGEQAARDLTVRCHGTAVVRPPPSQSGGGGAVGHANAEAVTPTQSGQTRRTLRSAKTSPRRRSIAWGTSTVAVLPTRAAEPRVGCAVAVGRAVAVGCVEARGASAATGMGELTVPTSGLGRRATRHARMSSTTVMATVSLRLMSRPVDRDGEVASAVGGRVREAAHETRCRSFTRVEEGP